MNRRETLLLGGAAVAMSMAGQSVARPLDGFVVPPEEAPHQATFMQWPVHRRVHPDPVFLEVVQQAIADIADAISEFEPVILLAARDDHATARLKLSKRVTLWDIPTDDLWCRDAGPLFAVNGAGDLAVRHIQFNGWGKKQVHRRDAQIASLVADRLKLPVWATGLQGEAGGVEHDGHGLLLAHESSWLNDNRNPGLSRDDIENWLVAAYGADRMIWSGGVIGEDITDYHIDSLARFTGPGRVLMNLPDDPDPHDPFHIAALETRECMVEAGLQVEVIPEPVHRRVESIDFVASYANYYVCNGAVIAAEFGDKETDQIAQEALTRHYPDREIVMLNVDPLGEMGGGIHCATQHMPTA